jgi:hypothetical protein
VRAVEERDSMPPPPPPPPRARSEIEPATTTTTIEPERSERSDVRASSEGGANVRSSMMSVMTDMTTYSETFENESEDIDWADADMDLDLP